MARPSESARLFKLLSALHALKEPRAYSFEELAVNFNCSIDEAKKIIDELSECTIDGIYLNFFYLDDDELPPCGGILICGDLNAMPRAIKLSPSEISALVCAMDFINIDSHDALRRKLANSAFSTYASPLESIVFISTTTKAHIAGQLELLCSQRRYCDIWYESIDGNEMLIADLAPVEMTVSNIGIVYLKAINSTGNIRRYRLDRISDVKAQAKHYMKMTLIDDFGSEDHPELVLRIAKESNFDPREWQGASPLSDDGDYFTWNMPIFNKSWVSKKVLSMFEDAQIVFDGSSSISSTMRKLSTKVLQDIEELEAEFLQDT